MLILYDTNTGAVLDNTGINTALPEGPEGDSAYINTDARGIPRSNIGMVRLHDEHDADLAQRVLTHQVTIDGGQVVVGAPIPKPEPTPEVVTGRTLRDRAAAALDANRLFLDDKSPTNAEVLTQVRALTRQNQGLIRLVLNKLDGVD